MRIKTRLADPEAIEKEFLSDKGRGWLMRWLPSRAHDNGLFLIFSNGVGVDDDEIRTGNAMILDPYGRILAETWKAGDAMVIADLDARLAAAAQFLTDTDRAVADIALACGFYDHSAFTRAFRRWHGMTPHDWRLQQGA